MIRNIPKMTSFDTGQEHTQTNLINLWAFENLWVFYGFLIIRVLHIS